MRIAAVLVAWLACGTVAPAGGADDTVRPPAVAGAFYPDDPARLRADLDGYLAKAGPPAQGTPVAIIAPHAGYVFSGQVAAAAFAQVADRQFDTVVLLGVNHTTPGFSRVALYRGTGFRTPLGVASIDVELGDALARADPDVTWNNGVHAREHSIEVEVPFVQRLWPRAHILPVIVASEDLRLTDRLGRALAAATQGKRVLIVASSDLSHYAAASDAERSDRRFLDAVVSMDASKISQVARSSLEVGVPGLVTAACGEAPILVAVAAARALGANRAVLVRHATSAETPGADRGRTVGYGAVLIGRDVALRASSRPAEPLEPATSGAAISPAEGAQLVTLAREAIRQYLESRTTPAPPSSPRLQQPQGAFVTLRKNGNLRGCIGRIVADTPLSSTVLQVAVGAAVQDPRFPPVKASELSSLEVEVSVLTVPREVGGPGDIVVGRDGVVLDKQGHTAVFLPEVATEQRWGRDEMLDHLCQKAGLPAMCWRGGARLSTFQAQVFRETPHR